MSSIAVSDRSPRFGLIAGERAVGLLSQLRLDVLARRNSSDSGCHEAVLRSQIASKQVDAAEKPTVFPGDDLAKTGLKASALYPGFKLIAKDWGYDALLVAANDDDSPINASEFVPGEAIVDLIEIDGSRAFLDLLACTPWVITNSTFAGSVSLGFGNRVSFGWFNEREEREVRQFLFGAGANSNSDVVDFSKSIDEFPPIPVPRLSPELKHQVAWAESQELHRTPSATLKQGKALGWGDVLSQLPPTAGGFDLLLEKRQDHFSLLDSDLLLPLVDHILAEGLDEYQRVVQTLQGGKFFDISNVSRLTDATLLTYVLRWDEPLDPPAEINLSMMERRICVPVLGRKPFQSMFDFDIIANDGELRKRDRWECEVVTENGSSHLIAMPSFPDIDW